MITYTELLKEIKEINIVNYIINDVKKSNQLDKWDEFLENKFYEWDIISDKHLVKTLLENFKIKLIGEK
jgi:hypothetical protein